MAMHKEATYKNIISSTKITELKVSSKFLYKSEMLVGKPSGKNTMLQDLRKKEMTYYKRQHFSVQNNLDEIRAFQNMINCIHKFQSLVTSMVDVHRQKPCVTSHIQRNALVPQFKNLSNVSALRHR
jgi:hypothetical protein